MFIRFVIKLFKMSKKFDFDYIIIGSGSAGYSAALTLAKLSPKKQIALIEGEKFGGTLLSVRDLPYSHIYSEAKNGNKYGISSINLHFNFPTAVNMQEKAAKKIAEANKEELQRLNVSCIPGTASFINQETILVGSRKITGAKIIIATGTKTSTGEISGIDFVDYLTSKDVVKSRKLPKAVCVVGGGANGCEIAEYYAELGVKTIILERSDRLLPREDAEVGKAIEDHFVKKLGIAVLTGARAVALEKDRMSKRVVFSKDNHEKMVRVDTVVMATGLKPNLEDLGLENAGIAYKNTGIVIDNKTFQTSVKNIYAIGGVTKNTISADIAAYQGTFIASALALKNKGIVNYAGYPRVINTYPEVATVGFNEDDLLKQDKHCRRATVKLDEVIASKLTDFDNGFVKILANKDSKIIGATIVAPNASVLIQELAMAIRHGFGVLEIASTPHDSRSFGSAIQKAAKIIAAQK